MSISGLVTILFTDLVGSTELSSGIGDVAADALRREHFADLRAAIAETSGREVKTIGDAVMVSYSSAADALAGAVAMQVVVDRRNRRSDGPPLLMRIGVSAGDATFEDGDWFGTPVVEAARLCAGAQGRQILVSDLVRALAGSRSQCELVAVGDRELKGFPGPMAVCEVTWTPDLDDSSAVVDLLPLPGFVETSPTFPFAGRAAERERLVTAWKEAADGSRRVVLVSGEPGVGKTRLVTETVRLAHEQGALVLWGRCAEELDVPHQPFVEALRHYVHSVPAGRLRDELGPLGGELTRLIPDLAHLVPGLPDPVHTESETERYRLFEAVGDLIEAMCVSVPVVLVLDDLHWSDKPSLLLLRHLLRRSATIRLLILGTYRDTDLDRSHPLSNVLADLRREAGVERVDLQGLDAAEVTEFMEHAAGHDLDAPALELAAAVHRETEGNPFFVGEMLLHLAESGLIVQRDGRWESDFTLGEVGIPEGIREVIGRRLSLLSETANLALTIGAAIGAEFDVAVITVVSGIPADDVFDALDQAATASIVREMTGTFGRYAFSHALVRSTLYEELSTNRRVRMHAQIGEAIEAQRASDLDAHLDALAHHFSEGALAGDPAKAIGYCQRAAARATADLAFEAAVRHLERGIGLLELLDGPAPRVRFDLQLGLIHARRATSDKRYREAGYAAADTARSMADPDRLALAALAMTHHIGSTGVVDEDLVALIDDALDALGPEASPIRARLLAALSVELHFGGDGERRKRLGAESVDMARATGDPQALASTLVVSWTQYDGSEPSIVRHGQALREAEALTWDDPVVNLHIHHGLIAMCTATGELAEAHRRVGHQLALAAQFRQPYFLWLARNDEALVSAFLGDPSAEEQAMGAMVYGLEHGVDESSVMSALGGLLYLIRRGQGRADEMVPTLEQLVESQPGLSAWRVALAGALTECGRANDAAEHVEYLTHDRCAAVSGDVGFPVTMCSLGRLSRAHSIDEDTMRYMYDRLRPFSGTFNFSGVSISDANDYGLAVLAARLGDFAASDVHFRAALDLCERSSARPFAAATHLDWARLLAERGEDGAAKEQARLAIEVGSTFEAPGSFAVKVLASELMESLPIT